MDGQSADNAGEELRQLERREVPGEGRLVPKRCGKEVRVPETKNVTNKSLRQRYRLPLWGSPFKTVATGTYLVA